MCLDSSSPKKTLRELDRICNDFFWGDLEGKKKLHLVGQPHTFLPKHMGGLGIRSHSDLNDILLAKLGWKMTQGEDNLAKECITSKYVRANYILAFRKGSQVWKNIGRGAPILDHSTRWKLGDGRLIRVWEDDWLGIGPIRKWIQGPLGRGEGNLSVAELISNNEWNLHPISICLPDFIKDRITYSSPPNSHLSDKSFSNLIHKGKFSMSLAYNQVVANRASRVGGEWVWRLNIPPKLQIFAWLVWWGRLPTRGLLQHRQIIHDSRCTCCHLGNESVIHVLRDCIKASQVWELVTPPTSFWTEAPGEWFRECVRSTKSFEGVSWETLIPFVCFEIWKGRNAAVFEDKQHPSPQITLKKALALTRSFIAHQDNPVNSPCTVSNCRLNISHPWVHVNVDASFVDIETKTSLACVIRDYQGIWCQGFYCLSYASNPLHAELLAIRQGLHMASEANYTFIALHSDCQEAVQMVNSTNELYEDFYSDIIMECRELRHYFQEMSITFVKRKNNQVADALSHKCRSGVDSLNVIRNLPFPPNYCLDLLTMDCKRLFAITA